MVKSWCFFLRKRDQQSAETGFGLQEVNCRGFTVYASLRTLAAKLVGMFVAFVLVVVVELLSAVVHPIPEDFGGTNEEMCRHVERIPHWVLALVVPAWAGTAFVGTWTARRMGNLYSFAIVSLLLLVALVFNISMLPYPLWFKIVILHVIPASVVAGGRLSARSKTASTGSGVEPGASRCQGKL
jgi:hypothetical protein